VTSVTSAGGQGREVCLGFMNGEFVSTRRWSFSGPLLTGRVANESLLGSEPRNMMSREETVVKL
jgi:hypothetical protein